MELEAEFKLERKRSLRLDLGNKYKHTCLFTYPKEIKDIPRTKFRSNKILTDFHIHNFVEQDYDTGMTKKIFSTTKDFFRYLEVNSGKVCKVLVQVTAIRRTRLYAESIQIKSLAEDTSIMHVKLK